MKQIRDRDIDDTNYVRFARCSVLEHGLAVRFCYPCGDCYYTTVQDILSWFEKPNCLCVAGRAQAWPDDHVYAPPSDIRIRAVRRVASGHALRVYMEDNTAFDVAWDTVLMALEPRYEWFGGLPEKIIAQM